MVVVGALEAGEDRGESPGVLGDCEAWEEEEDRTSVM